MNDGAACVYVCLEMLLQEGMYAIDERQLTYPSALDVNVYVPACRRRTDAAADQTTTAQSLGRQSAGHA